MYEIEKFEHEGLVVRIVNDEDPQEPDWGEDEMFLTCPKKGYTFGRRTRALPAPEHHLPWGIGPWAEYGDEIPKPPSQGGESEAYDLYEEWQAEYDDTYVVWPFRCYNAHGSGTGQLHVVGEERWEDADGWVYVKRIQSSLERLAYPDRDETTLRDQLIEVYAQWANGDVWGFIVEDSDGEELDSCWGFYGTEAAIEEGKSVAGHLAGKTRLVRMLVLKHDNTWHSTVLSVPHTVPDSQAPRWSMDSGNVQAGVFGVILESHFVAKAEGSET
jgi:hypothetical protein